MAQVKKHAKIRDRISECSLFSKSYLKIWGNFVSFSMLKESLDVFLLMNSRWNLNFLKILNAHCQLRQCPTTESPLKMMKITSYFALKAVFVLEIFRFLDAWR